METTAAPTPELPPPATPERATTRRELTAGHIAALIIGCLLVLPGLAMVAGGGFALVGNAIATDDDGYFELTLDRLETDGVAIAATDLTLDGDTDAADWLLDWLDVDVRLRVDGARSTDAVFVGIARSDDVERYLDGSSYADLIEVDGRSPRYRNVSGTRSIEPPSSQDFWVEQAAGPGRQELVWEARGGQWSVVVMNADGSPVVAADAEVGVSSGALVPIAVTLLAIGVLVTATGIVLIVVGARGRRVPLTPEPGSGHGGPLAPPSPASAVQLDDEVQDPVSVG